MQHRPLLAALVAALGLAAAAAPSHASEPAFLITRADTTSQETLERRHQPIKGFVQIGYPLRDAVGLIHRPVLVPSATVSKAVSETPVLPHLARLQVGVTTILIDPEVNYLAEQPGGIDENHSIVKAQRTWKALNAKPAFVTRRVARPVAGSVDAAVAPTPRAILLRPDLLDKKPAPAQDGMPVIPRPQKHDDRPSPMALAQ